MASTNTSYLGLRLPHPFIAGASPFGYHLDSVRRLEDAGAAAVVLHSLFEEQITMMSDGRIAGMDPFDPAFAEIIADFPARDDYPLSADAYAEHVNRLKGAVRIPIIASLNGTSPQSWLRFARIIEQAGADALEINPYEVVTNPGVPGVAVERALVDIVRDLKRVLRIPIAVKLSPFYTATANLARQLDEAGADGLVLFNRFYQPDIDIRSLKVVPTLDLSTSAELRLRLRWIAILLRTSAAIVGDYRRRRDARGRHQSRARRRRRHPARVGPAPTWTDALDRDAGGARTLAGLARVDLARRRARTLQPATRIRRGGVRTRSVHPHPPQLGTLSSLVAAPSRSHCKRLTPGRQAHSASLRSTTSGWPGGGLRQHSKAGPGSREVPAPEPTTQELDTLAATTDIADNCWPLRESSQSDRIPDRRR